MTLTRAEGRFRQLRELFRTVSDHRKPAAGSVVFVSYEDGNLNPTLTSHLMKAATKYVANHAFDEAEALQISREIKSRSFFCF